MQEKLPRTSSRDMTFANGTAIGMSHRWQKGQYCSILTAAGIVGCGIYDLHTPAEFGQAIAIAKGTPNKPLTEPEDLLEAPIVGVTPRAEELGIHPGMIGREAVELMLKAEKKQGGQKEESAGIQVLGLDHVTLVVKDLGKSRRFYVEVLGMREVPRPAFSFDGLWFQAGQTQIHLILEFSGSGPAGNLVPAEKRSSRTHHFAFQVADAEKVIPMLESLRVPVLSGPKPRPDGWIQVFVTDPDGHVVELCSAPKGRG